MLYLSMKTSPVFTLKNIVSYGHFLGKMVPSIMVGSISPGYFVRPLIHGMVVPFTFRLAVVTYVASDDIRSPLIAFLIDLAITR